MQRQSEVSRRSFLRYASLAASVPILTESHLAWAAATPDAAAKPTASTAPTDSVSRMMRPAFPPGAVIIASNENPLGPSEAACHAIADVASKGGRYDIYGMAGKLVTTFADQNGLKPDYVLPYPGSSEPLHFSILALTGPNKSFVCADPTYEAGGRAAAVADAKVIKVPLKADYSHDVKAMVAADPNAGVIYICNPNNPTGTTTTREDILWALENKPKGSVLLVDEAYIHLSDAKNVLDQAAADKDIIILRTFSKVYGMAGLRAGFAVGRPDLLKKMQPYSVSMMPLTSSAAAQASLDDAKLVPYRKALIADTRNKTFAFLKQNGYKFIPSESNCFMIDVGRPGSQVIAAMRERNIFIGRTWPIWPNAVRVSVGTPEEMSKFQIAFKEVMNQPVLGNVRKLDPFEPVPYQQFA